MKSAKQEGNESHPSHSNMERIGKTLAYVLRHVPESIGITLDSGGWANIQELLAALNNHGTKIDRVLLESIIAQDSKQRYKISEDGQSIRASQGHSINVNLNLTLQDPPDVLYHGTASRFMDSIYRQGLIKMSRMYVHLSSNRATAQKVGERHGKPVILVIDSKRMVEAGIKFFLSDNGVWLTDHVPVEYFREERKTD